MGAEWKTSCDVLKVDSQLGVVFGWAMIQKKDGEDYYDLQGDHADPEGLIEAGLDFALSEREGNDMHEVADGIVPFVFPLTEEVAKAYGITCDRYGLLIGYKPESRDTLAKFADGTYRGFSIGGIRIEEEVVEP